MFIAAGHAATPNQYEPGDFILTHGDAFSSRLIRVGERIRRGRVAAAYFNHAAMITSTSGDLVEALGDGVDRTHLSKYTPKDYAIFSIASVAPTMPDRQRVVRFANSCVGLKYDWLDILSISISLLTGSKVSIMTEGHLICSGLVARALERSNAILPYASQAMMPADLAVYFNTLKS